MSDVLVDGKTDMQIGDKRITQIKHEIRENIRVKATQEDWDKMEDSDEKPEFVLKAEGKVLRSALFNICDPNHEEARDIESKIMICVEVQTELLREIKKIKLEKPDGWYNKHEEYMTEFLKRNHKAVDYQKEFCMLCIVGWQRDEEWNEENLDKYLVDANFVPDLYVNIKNGLNISEEKLGN